MNFCINPILKSFWCFLSFLKFNIQSFGPASPLHQFRPRKQSGKGTKMSCKLMLIPASRILCCGGNRQINSHGLQKSFGEKGTAWPLSKWERAGELERAQEREPTPAWTSFYCFSRPLTSRMVLIYYAQVHCRWLPFTDSKGQNTADYFKEKDVTAQGGKWLNWLHSILGMFSADFRKLKILS